MMRAGRPYVPPMVVTLGAEDITELLGPVETQYATETVTATDCLPNSLSGVDTTQDQWQINIKAPMTVTVRVDSMDIVPGQGPLDPKYALYPPGVTPAVGPFNGYNHPDCAGDCIVHDGMNCTAVGLPANVCPTLAVTLNKAGNWTIAVAPDVAAPQVQSRGCYEISVTGPKPPGLNPLALVVDNGTVTFFK